MKTILLLVILGLVIYAGWEYNRIDKEYEFLEGACMYNFYHMEVPDKNGKCVRPAK